MWPSNLLFLTNWIIVLLNSCQHLINEWHRGFLFSVAWEYLALLDGKLSYCGEGCPLAADGLLWCFAVGCFY